MSSDMRISLQVMNMILMVRTKVRTFEDQIKLYSTIDTNSASIYLPSSYQSLQSSDLDMNNIPGFNLTAGNNGVGFFEGNDDREEGGYRPPVSDSIMTYHHRSMFRTEDDVQIFR